jgi:hypothetical protein
MAFNIDQVVPWGRSLEEYTAMFALSQSDLDGSILGCGDGPASFNVEMYLLGKNVISVDPIYRCTTLQIQERVEEAYPMVMEQLYTNSETFVWRNFDSPEHVGRVRQKAMQRFLSDFDLGKEQRRYRPYELPVLPFEDHQFDLALSSHLLFLYADQLPTNFHLKAIKEMLRVAKEVRIFPLLTMNGALYPHMHTICTWIEKHHHHYRIEKVPYEFQRGGNRLLRIW